MAVWLVGTIPTTVLLEYSAGRGYYYEGSTAGSVLNPVYVQVSTGPG